MGSRLSTLATCCFWVQTSIEASNQLSCPRSAKTALKPQNLNLNAPDAMQTILNRLDVYARSKHLTISTAKRGALVPFFHASRSCSDSSRYLGVTFHRTLDMTASYEHAATPMHAPANRIRGSVQDTALCDRSFASLWLAKAYVVPAGLYGCQVWSSGFLHKGHVFKPTLQRLHLNLLKGTLGVKQSAPNWAVLCECGHILWNFTGLELL